MNDNNIRIPGTPITMSVRTCKGPHPACKAAYKLELPFHAYPLYVPGQPSLVLPTYHFASVSDAYASIGDSYRAAKMINNDDELYAAREAGVPHFIPVGFIDPSRR